MKTFFKNLAVWLDHPKAIYFVIGFGLTLRLAVLLKLSSFPLVSDAFHYHHMARQLLQGENFAPYWPPGLPYYLLFFLKIFGVSELVSRASLLLFYFAFSLFLYLVAKEMFSSRAANAAALIFSVYPTYLHLSLEPLTQLPVAAGLLAVVYLLLRTGRQSSPFLLAGLGLLLGWLALMRPSALLLVLLVPLFLAVKTKKIFLSLLPLVFSISLISLWMAKAYRMTGDLVPINYANSLNFYFGNNPYTPLYKTWWFGSHGAGETDVPKAFTKTMERINKNPLPVRERLYRQLALGHIFSRPDLFLIRTFNRMRNYFAFDTFTGSYLVKDYKTNKMFGLFILGLDAAFFCALMLLALVFLFHSGKAFLKQEAAVLLLGTAAVYALPYWLSFSHPVHHFPTLPLIGLLSAGLLALLLEKTPGEMLEPMVRSPKRKYGLILALLFFLYIQAEWVWVMHSRV